MLGLDYDPHPSLGHTLGFGFQAASEQTKKAYCEEEKGKTKTKLDELSSRMAGQTPLLVIWMSQLFSGSL